MGIEIPESAKIVLLQEGKFKSYFNDLAYALKVGGLGGAWMGAHSS
jgi:hypothetical protein